MSNSISDLAVEALRAIDSEPCCSNEIRYIACIACPSVMRELVAVDEFLSLKIIPYVFQYDKNMKRCNGHSQSYNYKEPDAIHPCFLKRFSLAIVVPPNDSNECLLNTAIFTRKLLKNQDCKIILYTSLRKSDLVHRAFGAEKINFQPNFDVPGLQENACYANYTTVYI